jgi:hypothetical protein
MNKPIHIAPDFLTTSMQFIEYDAHKRHKEAVGWVNGVPHLKVRNEVPEGGRAPYNASFTVAPGGRFFYSDKVAVRTGTLELEGKACQSLWAAGHFADVVQHLQDHGTRFTRFDLAVDIETTTTPAEFAALRSSRFDTIGAFDSATGSTRYVGSQKSSRFCRVYRYNKPHERHKMLRVEMVFKKPDADGAVRDFFELGPAGFAAACGNIYGWTHPDWDMSSEQRIRTWRPEKGRASTLTWLRKQVIPALSDLYDSDVLDKTHPIWDEIAQATPLNLERPEGRTGEETDTK